MSISFIMPAYNAEGTIKESIYSILKSNFDQNDELIITNDCSTDQTENIIKEIIKTNPEANIRLINHEFNKGGAAARNTSVESAKNQLIFCLDSDNVLATNSIEPLQKKLLKEKADVAVFQEIRFFNNDKSNPTHSWFFDRKSTYNFEQCLSNTIIPAASGNYLYTRDSWIRAGRYPEFAGALDAWGFGVKQAAAGCKTVVLKDSYYYHRHGHDSYWTRENNNGDLSLKALQVIIPYLPLINDDDVEYIFSKDNRLTWYLNVDKHPIRLKKTKKLKKLSFKRNKKSNLRTTNH